MTKDQRKTVQMTRGELESEAKHIANYLKALMRGTPVDPKLPTVIKARVDSLIEKHTKTP